MSVAAKWPAASVAVDDAIDEVMRLGHSQMAVHTSKNRRAVPVVPHIHWRLAGRNTWADTLWVSVCKHPTIYRLDERHR
jgi:hypothetical protein